MSTTEKDLLETYEEIFGKENHMLKSGMYPNDDEKSSTCECTDTNTKLARTKGKDKYLENLKERCKGGIGFCSVGSVLLTLVGLIAAKAAATKHFVDIQACLSHMAMFKLFSVQALGEAIKAGGATCIRAAGDIAGTAAPAAMTTFPPYGIAALVILILAVVLIILYIWLYRRRKNSWKHECKKHLCR
ncbi:hypothetical protein PFTANZ_04183 [Plasmodium falciparum Tanzania (2000708)]|uniref:Surface antigen n=1 Tax=Plasmodium falciparum Tanzania (2000708) TaxID=1036725 RepID=A0A024W3M3_PLAFA|nr:hypothetical protein PFTANZ_04183 [Plasmodium falciparum Tanzania (2000708)]